MVFPNRPCSVISPSYGLICRTFSSNPNLELTSIFSYKKFSDLFLSVCVPLVPSYSGSHFVDINLYIDKKMFLCILM